ncbi:hypothetical protein PFDSM3638_06445 [Pyrococcus furiosus DSM 3638]|uniref:Polysaccharide biosynthesis protein C-terminal domain-containing protein n=3 Tax=Pyrococcus furiosus TaxID=2261 RepID=Q8U1C5_PYRFU|nr:polysaccharide biosynthesis C-terminal domain-containing protein [Pyrococcus furiosus]AAL81416.1 hypothetical protein PF1292 [Pyrococcus furiosus DSM 3638]AFN04076.1 hypothetical protein PFC_05675 [Pyrococcus furiosus COM1]QEK78933.1 hypothetical protein PFDSM3638_06445 [Pyrococcus furiosus DSM 3638]
MDRKKVMVRHSIASLVALGIFGGSRFLYNVIIGRKYGVETLGYTNSIISQAFFVAGFLAFFSVGLGKFTSEFLGKGEYNRIKKLTGISFTFPFLGLILIPLNFHVALLSVLRAIQLTFRSFIYGLHKGELYAYSVILAFPFFLLGFLDGPLLPYYLLLGTIGIFSLSYLVSRSLIGLPGREDTKALIGFSTWAFLGTIAGIFLLQAPYFLTEKLAGNIEAGIVSVALSTAFLLSYLPQILQSAIVPLYAYDYAKGDDKAIKELAENSTLLLSLFSSLLVFGLIFAKSFVEVLFNIKMGAELLLALIGVELYIAYNPLINLLTATKFVKKSAIFSLIGAMVSGIFWILLIPRLGAIGTLLGLTLGYAIIFALVLWESKRKFNINAKILKPTLLAIPLQLLSLKFPYTILIYLITEIKDIEKVMAFLRDIRS